VSNRFDVVVTRFPAVVEYLKDIGLIDDQTEVCLAPVKQTEIIEKISGKRVIGDLSLRFAALAKVFTRVRFRTTADERRNPKLMTKDKVIKKLAETSQPIVTYEINKISEEEIKV